MMKNKLIFTVSLLVFFISMIHAQTMKIGYADVDYILSQMPESKQVESELQAHNTQLQNQMQAKYEEYQQKLKTYQDTAADMIDAVRGEKETELSQLEQRIQKFQQDAQTSMQNKSSKLMDPLYKKVGSNIEIVAKENGYTHVFSGQIGGIDIILYSDQKFDISDLVLKKMGITPTDN